MKPSKPQQRSGRRLAAPQPAQTGTEAQIGASEATVLLTADELAQRFGCRRQHIYALAREGGLPHLKLGKYIRFREHAVAAWLDQQERQD
jgi:excisionase family DNA binding protein